MPWYTVRPADLGTGMRIPQAAHVDSFVLEVAVAQATWGGDIKAVFCFVTALPTRAPSCCKNAGALAIPTLLGWAAGEGGPHFGAY